MKYVFDDNHNKHEALDKEGVEALLALAIQEGELPSVDEDTAFVTMLKDPITGVSHKIAFVTQAQYNQLKADDELIPNAYYFITDDTTADDLEAHLVQNDARVSDLENGMADYYDHKPQTIQNQNIETAGLYAVNYTGNNKMTFMLSIGFMDYGRESTKSQDWGVNHNAQLIYTYWAEYYFDQDLGYAKFRIGARKESDQSVLYYEPDSVKLVAKY